MMKFILSLSWIIGTAAALLVVFGAVGFVAARMGDAPSGVLARENVRLALASASPGSTGPSASASPSASSSASASALGSPAASASPSSGVPASSPPQGTAAGSAAPSVASLPPTASPSSPASTAAPGAGRTFDLVGGSTRVSCAGTLAQVDWASPKPSFAVEVQGSGTAFMEVRFRSATHESKLEVTCTGGVPTAEIRERAR